MFEANSFVKYDAKIGSNNGFDGVYIKGDLNNPTEIIINEAKQVGTMGNIKLNRENLGTGLKSQMSDEWVYDNVIPKLQEQGGSFENLANLILNNRAKVVKTVTAVDRTTGEVVVLKLSNY